MKQYVSKYAQCPFYRKEDSMRLFCEGVEEGSNLAQFFGSQERKTDFKQRFCCCKNWEQCPIAMMLAKKYE